MLISTGSSSFFSPVFLYSLPVFPRAAGDGGRRDRRTPKNPAVFVPPSGANAPRAPPRLRFPKTKRSPRGAPFSRLSKKSRDFLTACNNAVTFPPRSRNALLHKALRTFDPTRGGLPPPRSPPKLRLSLLNRGSSTNFSRWRWWRIGRGWCRRSHSRWLP